MHFKTKFKEVVSSRPLRLINIVFFALSFTIAVYGVVEYVSHKREIDNISQNLQKKILLTIKNTTDTVLEIMEHVREIYTIEPLLMAKFNELRSRDGIESQILLPPPMENLPEHLHSTPEKVEYWLEEKGGKEKLAKEDHETIKIFLKLLKEREETEEAEEEKEGKKEEEAKTELLERYLDTEKYEKLVRNLKNNYSLIESNNHFDIYFGKEGNELKSFAAFKRDHKECIGCHGYDGDRPLLIHFSKDISTEINLSKTEIYGRMKHKLTALFALIPLYLISYILLHDSVKKREEERATAEKALIASGDVLNSLCLPPRILPYFVTSPVFRHALSTGGGDSVHWIGFRFRYAAFCIQDVSGHGIQETLLNIYSSSIMGHCKISNSGESINMPSEFFKRMNRDIYEFCGKTSVYKYHFVAAVYVLLDYVNRGINFSLAGNPLPILVKPDGAYEKIGAPGLILGMFDEAQFQDGDYVDTKLKLKTGEIIVFYSDGLMEQKNKDGVTFREIFEKEIMLKIAGENPKEAYEVIKDEYNRHIEGAECDDDVSFIIVGARPEDKYKTITLQEAGRHPGGLISACGPLIDSLRNNGWSRERLESVESVIRELHEGFVFHEKIDPHECELRIEYISHDDILELNLKYESIRLHPQGIIDEGEHEDLLERWKSRVEKIKTEVDEIYVSETGVSFWALIKGTRAEIEKAEA